MCRLFGLSAVPEQIKATFWLLDAADSLAEQSRREPDGVGLGFFDGERPVVHKRPVAAYRDAEFAREAREVRSSTFLAHIRYASTGGLTPQNTHPFVQDGRLLAHNGVIGGLPQLERELGDAMDLVEGETDSERFFALVTCNARANGGDVGDALRRAARWVSDNLPLYALNVLLTTSTDLWALRYPDTHELWVLERGIGGQHGDRHLEQASAAGTVRVRSGDLGAARAVVVASERMDEHPGWRLMNSGELLHIGPDLSVDSSTVLGEAPRHPLTLADLSGQAAASQGRPAEQK